ncbi:alkaline shock response membrane anchor protein AmaP [Lactococcus lactis]|uniref:alkaline shock response membrane anchor protein AmaP n=1 Tax=Lactococcus lactis TaxID=1358 RepID=UPI000BF4497C|nr:alkaline shock response membrane anchor protein AmaP [Lactococcus lactis]PFG87381.1 hypothetical protein BW153_02555 [Lactococcus lactis]
MAIGKKIFLIIVNLLLLTLFLPIAWDYYNFMEYDWITTTSSFIPIIGKYMPKYLFWGSIILAILLVITLFTILYYPRTHMDVEFNSNNGTLILKRSAIEGFINEKVKENDYLKNSKTEVKLYNNKISVKLKGDIIPRVNIALKANILEQEIIEDLRKFFGLNQTVKINVEVTSLNKDDNKRLRVT